MTKPTIELLAQTFELAFRLELQKPDKLRGDAVDAGLTAVIEKHIGPIIEARVKRLEGALRMIEALGVGAEGLKLGRRIKKAVEIARTALEGT